MWVAKISRVKLRGFRIELSDVQANVVEASREVGRKVDACLCVVREDQLIAFVATEDPTIQLGTSDLLTLFGIVSHRTCYLTLSCDSPYVRILGMGKLT